MTDNIIDHFLFRACVSGVLLAALSGPLGSLVLWQRMSFLGDTLSHSALLGIAFSCMFDLPLTVGTLTITILIALMTVLLQTTRRHHAITVLAIVSQGSLALGMIFVSYSRSPISLLGLLFGDLLALTRADMVMLLILVPTILIVLSALWRDLLKTIISQDIAAVEGVHSKRVQIISTLLLAISIALASRLVGVLLATSLLIIPAAAARYIANTPAQMATRASLLASLSVLGGIGNAWVFNLPTCPSITVVALAIFLILFFIAIIKKKGYFTHQ